MSSSQFRFLTTANIRFGRGSARESVPDLAGLADRILLCQGRNGARADWLAEALANHGCEVVRFSVADEPDIDLVGCGVELAREHQAKAVVAIGGGAVIDAGKAIAALVPAKRPMMDHLEVVGRGLPLEQKPVPFAALPTTAGTGAEVTKNAVLSVPDAKRKVSLRDPDMLPNLAIVDPSLTDNLPRMITLASGLDAVTQVIEPYLSCKANWLTDTLCRDAIPRGLNALTILMDQEDQDARDELAWTSLCGGLALANSGLGAVHGFAGVLGGRTGAAHGAVCGALLPHVLKVNAERIKTEELEARFQMVGRWIAEALGCKAEQAFDSLADWSSHQGLQTLGKLGLKLEDIPDIARESQASSSMKGNPVALSREDLEAILKAAL